MSKNKNKNPKKGGSKIELVSIPTATRRDDLSIEYLRKAVKEAEDVKNPSRTKLLDLYNDIERDAHLTSVIEKRRDAIRATKITFKTKSGKPNEKINELIKLTFFNKLLVDILDARLYGTSACWLDLSGGEFVSYKILKRKHTIPEKTLWIEKQTDKEGIDYSKPPYSNYIVNAGDSEDFGMLLKAVAWVLFKRGDISDWATFLEVFAMPFQLAKYPQYDEVAKKALADALNNSGSMQKLLIPNTTDLSFIQNSGSGSTTGYLEFAEFCDKQLSKLFLHNTLTTDAEGGQYKGEIHAGSEKTVTTSDTQCVLDVLNTDLLRILELHGFNPQGGCFECVEEDRISLKDRIAIDEKVAKQVEIPAEYWHEKYGIPIPEGGAKLKVQPQPQVQAAENLALEDRIAWLTEQFEDMQKLETPPRSFFGQALYFLTGGLRKR